MLVEFIDFAVDTCTNEALVELGHQLFMFAFAVRDDWRQQHQLLA